MSNTYKDDVVLSWGCRYRKSQQRRIKKLIKTEKTHHKRDIISIIKQDKI